MSSSGVFCAICLRDARPLLEDLQSIYPCGHVFHELCLQQWMKYSQAGRDPTCFLCKQPISCPARDIYRLNFQSARRNSSQPQVSPSRNLRTAVEDPKHVSCSSAILHWRTESKLDATMALVFEQLKELEFQVAVILQRAEKAEAATVVGSSEVQTGLMSIQEELMCCSPEREKLQEENQAMASHELQARWDSLIE